MIYHHNKELKKQSLSLEQFIESEPFLLHRSYDNGFLVMRSMKIFTLLMANPHWMADGTFSIVPSELS